MDPKKVYNEHLPTIRGIAASVARRGRLNPQESEDFVQDVCVRLFEDDYRILRKFKGESRITTYLTTVIGRLLSQRRVEEWGKWRPSAEAKRIGEKAIVLEKLLSRDGYTFEEAVRILTTPAGSQYTRAELETIYARLPHRTPRPMEIASDVLPDAVAPEADAAERVERSEREQIAERVAKALDEILEELRPQDKLILKLRFWHEQKVPDIALVLHMDDKKIYKRIEQLKVVLRHGLERAGISKADVDRLLDAGDQEIKRSKP
jgi:RNA polymerase sigma factor (sigma-70 family)